MDINKFTEKAREAVTQAQSIAVGMGHQDIDSEHLALALIRQEQGIVPRILEQMGRGVTWWEGVGAYTGEGVHVLCVCLSKYEIEELFHTVHEMDPHAFITLQEGVRIYGNFLKKLD